MRSYSPLLSFLKAACLMATALGASLAGSRPAAADEAVIVTPPRPKAHALLVGSNQGGPGQAPLRFAESDAESVASVLREIGHYEPGEVRVLLHPTGSGVLSAIDELVAKVQAEAARGDSSQVFFYFSGHARASAVNLGGDELPVATLRDRLTRLPAALTIVVLDACQSGAFSRVKGAEPAADFTYNSVTGLTQKGLAVMASSTSEELSQESDELRGSYFTHHLVSALRGAGDADHDGRVSLDEAYRYAYRRTLASTAKTQVGEQHVTLETDLAGQGEVPVTFPAEAKAQLELPGPLEGRILVQQRASGSVAAEVQKVPGPPLRLALVSGAYDATVARGDDIVQCHVTLLDDQVTVLEPAGCTRVVPERAETKGPAERIWRERDRWEVEASMGFIWRETDAYTQRLDTFGYQSGGGLLGLPTGRFTLGVSRAFTPHIVGVLQLATLTGASYARSIEGSNDTVDLEAYGAAMYVRAQTDVAGWFGIYGQAGVGMSLADVTVATAQTGVPPSATTVYLGYLLSGAVGLTARLPKPHRVTFFAQAGYDRAPAIQNLIGDTHDSGGMSFVLGMRVRLGDPR